MRKEEIKKLLKCIVISIVIVTFIVRTVFFAASCILVKIRYEKLFTEKALTTEYREYLKDLEEWFNEMQGGIKNELGEDYPETGVLVEKIGLYNSSYQIQEYISCIIFGTGIGIAVYIMKSDYRKILHYVAIYILLFTILVLIESIYFGLGTIAMPVVVATISIVQLFEFVIEGIIPYTVMYLLGCIVVYLINKKTTKLNKDVNKE